MEILEAKCQVEVHTSAHVDDDAAQIAREITDVVTQYAAPVPQSLPASYWVEPYGEGYVFVHVTVILDEPVSIDTATMRVLTTGKRWRPYFVDTKTAGVL